MHSFREKFENLNFIACAALIIIHTFKYFIVLISLYCSISRHLSLFERIAQMDDNITANKILFVLPLESWKRPPGLSSVIWLKTVQNDVKSHNLTLTVVGWLRGTVVERRSLTGELLLSCARPAADG